MRTRIAPLLALPLLLLPLAACGETSKPEGTPPAGGYAAHPTPVEKPAPVPATPQHLGESAGQLYLATMKAVVEAMKGDPAPADLEKRLEALRTAAIPKFVDLGRARERLDGAGRAAMDGAIGMAVNTLPADLFGAFAKGQAAYQAKDAGLGNLISSFNVLTQYANFDLLRKQAPEEAKRLGIP